MAALELMLEMPMGGDLSATGEYSPTRLFCLLMTVLGGQPDTPTAMEVEENGTGKGKEKETEKEKENEEWPPGYFQVYGEGRCGKCISWQVGCPINLEI